MIFTLFLFLLPCISIAEETPVDSVATEKSQEDDFQPTPYTTFGDFNSDAEEAEDTLFFKYGRFFGLSFGAGFQGATGNRGILYNGGFPLVDFKIHYWFDFNLAMALNISVVNHSFKGALPEDLSNVTTYNVQFIRLGFDFRYYIDTTDLPAPITFASPFLVLGVGNYTRTQNNVDSPNANQPESKLGLSAGGGLQFTLKPRRTFFDVEGRIHSVNFDDTKQPVELGGGNTLPDQSGLLYTVVGSILFTW